MLVGGDHIDPVELWLRLDLITVTSPSVLLYGSIDGFRRRMVLQGKQLLGEALDGAAGLATFRVVRE
jgi:arginine decarboxylase